MIFNRTYRYNTALSMDDIRQRLLGQHIQVHHLDFEITEKEKMLRIIPHAEEANGIKTLPITHVEMQGNGTGTKIIVTSKPRKIDIGGPYLIIIFCLFCVLGASGIYMLHPDESIWPSITLISVGIISFVIFWLRMEAGYFDYTRKIRDYIKHHVH